MECTVVTVTVTCLRFKRYHAVGEKAGNTKIWKEGMYQTAVYSDRLGTGGLSDS